MSHKLLGLVYLSALSLAVSCGEESVSRQSMAVKKPKVCKTYCDVVYNECVPQLQGQTSALVDRFVDEQHCRRECGPDIYISETFSCLGAAPDAQTCDTCLNAEWIQTCIAYCNGIFDSCGGHNIACGDGIIAVSWIWDKEGCLRDCRPDDAARMDHKRSTVACLGDSPDDQACLTCLLPDVDPAICGY